MIHLYRNIVSITISNSKLFRSSQFKYKSSNRNRTNNFAIDEIIDTSVPKRNFVDFIDKNIEFILL